jgi:hypothetical protein
MGTLQTVLALVLLGLTPLAQEIEKLPQKPGKEARPEKAKPEKQPLTPESIAAYRKELETVLGPEATLKSARRTVLIARDHVDPSVIAVLDARALRHADLALRDYAVETMGYMRHPDVIVALHAMLERDAEVLAAAPERQATLFRAIGRQAKEESIPVLAAKASASTDPGVLTAGLLSLANIRTRASLDAVIELLRKAPRERVTETMPDFRAALVMLTGEDRGTEPDAWLAWYDEHREKLAVAPEPPAEIVPEVRRRWLLFWGPPRDEPKRTLERGKKPERKPK